MLTDKTIGNKPGAVMLLSPENTDDVVLKVLKREMPEFLLPITVINVDGEYEVRYELTGNRFSYFNDRMIKKDYIALLKNLLMPYKICSDWFLNYHNIYLNKHYMMYNKNDYSIQFAYIPIKELLHTDDEINKFFQNIVINIEVIDDTSYPMKLLRILMSDSAGPLHLLDIITEDENKTEENMVPNPILQNTVNIANQEVEMLHQPVNDSARWMENTVKNENKSKGKEVNKAEKQGFGFKKNNKKADPAPNMITPPLMETKAETSAPARPGAEFGKMEVGGEIMGNLFGDIPEKEKAPKAKKEKKEKKSAKPAKPEKQPKEKGLLGGIFNGKKTDQNENDILSTPEPMIQQGAFMPRSNDINPMGMSQMQSPMMNPMGIPQMQSPVMNPMGMPQMQSPMMNPMSMPQMQPPMMNQMADGQNEFFSISAYRRSDRTEIFEDDVYVKDDTLKLQLENSAGFNLPNIIEINLNKGYATIGRLDNSGVGQCDYNFDTSMSFISRTHLRIEKENYQIKIIDLNSSNGTFLNGTKIVPNISYPIVQGDSIMFSSKRRVTYKVL